ncbi:MAG: branched-chain amino acid ABC transporter permease [Planctomycetota bacterium]|nr:branched-chain amino acid ABC transporter permease [Planctomycetota bacterium]
MPLLMVVVTTPALDEFLQYCINGLAIGSLIALVALGYTMVYGIIGLINFAHGDVYMLGALLTLTLIQAIGLDQQSSYSEIAIGVTIMLFAVPCFCALVNRSIDHLVYKPLRHAPKLTALVSAIGVSFVLMNIGQLWIGEADQNVPSFLSSRNLLGADSDIRLRPADLLVVVIVIAFMIGLTFLVKGTRLGTAMRATSQNPLAAQLMGINVQRVIGATFLIGGALAGVGSVVGAIFNPTVNFQMGYQTGLYAFTAAVLGGIGSIPGAVFGGLVVGMVRSLGTGYIDERWTGAMVFGMLILILVFRPTGLLGQAAKEKV